MSSFFESIFTADTPLLDVRAPVEFKRGALPNAYNLPILNDEERELVGTCYKKHGQQQAIALGNKLVSAEKRQQRIAGWLAFIKQHPNGYLYCFRGGKRSQFARLWLKEHKVEYELVPGGYKAMRNYLIQELDAHSTSLPFVLISGRTGSGKTRLLSSLPCHIDLEGLAAHRGSSFGGLLSPQPSIISFENSLATCMIKTARLKPAHVFLEDEGKLIGRISLPVALRDRMLNLPAVMLVTTIEERVAVAEQDYISDLLTMYQTQYGQATGLQLFTNHHQTALDKIKKRFGLENFKTSLHLFTSGVTVLTKDGHTRGFHPYIEHLLTRYYDPMYDYQFKSKNRTVIFSGTADEVIDWCNHAIKRL